MDMIPSILKLVEDYALEPPDLKTILLAVAHILESHGNYFSPIISLFFYFFYSRQVVPYCKMIWVLPFFSLQNTCDSEGVKFENKIIIPLLLHWLNCLNLFSIWSKDTIIKYLRILLVRDKRLTLNCISKFR